MRTIRILNIVLLSMGIISTIGAQNFGRYANSTSPDDLISPSANYSKDLEKAVKKDADGTITLQLADCYMYGLGVDKNEKKAVKLYESAAKKYNNGEAMLVLADYYAQNNQAEKAYDYYKQSVDANYAPAQVIYGDMLNMIFRRQQIAVWNKKIENCNAGLRRNDRDAMLAFYNEQLGKMGKKVEELERTNTGQNMGAIIELRNKINNLAHERDRFIRNMQVTPQMKDSAAYFRKMIKAYIEEIQEADEIYNWMKNGLSERIIATQQITDGSGYLNYYKKAADQEYLEGMYCYAHFSKDYDYMPIAAAAGNYELYTELTDHYFDKILNNQDVSNSFSQLKKFSDLADQHHEESQKDFLTNIESNTPEYLVAIAKDSVTQKSRLTNGKLAAMNYALTIANDTSKLKAYLVQIVLERFSKQQDTIFNNLYVTLDKVSGPEKIQFCSVNVNHKLYTQTIYKCLNHIIEHDKDNRTLGDAWCLLAELAQDGKIDEFKTIELKRQKYDEYMSKAKMYGSRKAFDYVTIKELESKGGLTYYYPALRTEKKNEFNLWSQKVVNNCFYWMLKGNTDACLDYAQVMWDNHEGGVTPELDSTIIDAYQRAIDKGDETALYRQKAYKYLNAGGWGDPSVLEDIKANGTPNELIKFSQTLLDMGDDGGKALPVLKLALEANSADAYYALYKLYEDNRVKDVDVHNANKAMEALEKAIELGRTDLIYTLASNYLDEFGGLPRNEKKAVEWLQKGASIGDKNSIDGLAWSYAYGYGGLPVDFNKARELKKSIGSTYDFYEEEQYYKLKQRANNNDIKAIVELIRDLDQKAEKREYTYMLSGYSDEKRYNSHYRQEQLKWIKKGIALGDAESLYYMGYAYYFGYSGLKVDKAKALSYYKQSAAKKYYPACYRLGWCYEYGMDGYITPNRRQAAEYYRTAYNLGGGRDCERAWLRCIN